ncbi:hypothetical protein FHW96_003412 [Novosphingobium sp. SG751A]|uniref:hypothetical protein n=1 Tax=Novosphingobium sp. SG751A TaxID=2587000 RepID=UPI001551B043|nr:hypothetical protein [Novosphingobium sp. SG751A]NOW47234.1 hypothetical protein [Novosphingobium sp. SG751A]
MGNLDFPKVIAAAAVSPLGVLSLLVLVIAMIALSFFRRSGDSVKLVVFGGLLLSAVGFGTATMMAGQSSASDAPKPDHTSAPETPPTAQPLLPPSPALSSALSSGTAASMTGLWSSGDGFTFRFTQTGQSIAYDTIENGAKTGSGKGRIEGRHVTWHYIVDADGQSGDCSGTLSSDARMVTGQCASGSDKPWELNIRRQD